MCFMELISVGKEDTKYLINRIILQECRNVVEGCLTLENYVGITYRR